MLCLGIFGVDGDVHDGLNQVSLKIESNGGGLVIEIGGNWTVALHAGFNRFGIELSLKLRLSRKLKKVCLQLINHQQKNSSATKLISSLADSEL